MYVTFVRANGSGTICIFAKVFHPWHRFGVGLSLCHRRCAKKTALKSLLLVKGGRRFPVFWTRWGHLLPWAFRVFFGGRGVVPSCGLTQRHINCVNCISYYQVCGERLESFVTAWRVGLGRKEIYDWSMIGFSFSYSKKKCRETYLYYFYANKLQYTINKVS